MDSIEKAIKITLLSTFCFLNVVDTAHSIVFLNMGIESNPFALYHPQLWVVFKLAAAFGLPLGLYRADIYLAGKEDEGFTSDLKWVVAFFYLIMFFADILYLSIVLRNISVLGHFGYYSSLNWILYLPSLPP